MYVINSQITISLSDVDIVSADIPGFVVSSNDSLTVALDVTISEELQQEGLARELINRIQNLRKEKSFEVTDNIIILIENNKNLKIDIKNNLTYICDETLATELQFVDVIDENFTTIQLINQISVKVNIKKHN